MAFLYLFPAITEYLQLGNLLRREIYFSKGEASKSEMDEPQLVRIFLLHHPLAEVGRAKEHMGERAREGHTHFYNKPIPMSSLIHSESLSP